MHHLIQEQTQNLGVPQIIMKLLIIITLEKTTYTKIPKIILKKILSFYCTPKTITGRCIGKSTSEKKYQMEAGTFSLGKSTMLVFFPIGNFSYK